MVWTTLGCVREDCHFLYLADDFRAASFDCAIGQAQCVNEGEHPRPIGSPNVLDGKVVRLDAVLAFLRWDWLTAKGARCRTFASLYNRTGALMT